MVAFIKKYCFAKKTMVTLFLVLVQPPRYMTVNQALEQLLETIAERPDIAAVIPANSLCVGLSRVGLEVTPYLHMYTYI